ncbi:MAG TPA: DUF1844 domain-containing protein [Planctomycetota bacterium]|nr:DUF1844 domain-containing protein [Planctomycetota bacterium]
MSEAGRDADPASPARGAALPAPTFAFLVTNLATQALMALGEAPNPVTKATEFSAERAKFAIDLLDVLRVKTEGRLEDSERRFLEGALYELRMKYVRKIRQPDA